MVFVLSGEGRLPPVVLVGVVTGTPLDQKHSLLVLEDNKFYGFLVNELVPYIDAHFRTDVGKRTLIGHSDGAYAVLYAFLQYGKGADGPVFHNYIALSGDHGQEDRRNFVDEGRLFNRIGEGGSLDVALYMAWGGAEEGRFLSSNAEMTALLESRGYADFRFESVQLEGRDHNGKIILGERGGLLWVFEK